MSGSSGGVVKGYRGKNQSSGKLKFEVVLFQLQSYYTKAQKYTGEFEEDLNDALTEFKTACRSQIASEFAKPELFCQALSGSALNYYKLIDATKMTWESVQGRFRNKFISMIKQVEIRTELDTFNISTLHSTGDSDRQALD